MSEPKNNTCHSCKKPITDNKLIRVGDFAFHLDHFTCDKCNKNLHGVKFQHRRGVFFCTECYSEKYCHTCRVCNVRIKSGQFVQAFGGYYHMEHFVCKECQQPFPNGKYFEFEGAPYCSDHFVEKVAPRCTKCSKPIKDENEHVELKNKPYHVTCLQCVYCRQPLPAKDQLFQKEDQVFCKNDFLTFFARRCTACSNHILKQCVSANGEFYHPPCLKCGVCGNKLSSYICMRGVLRCPAHAQKEVPPPVCSICDDAINEEPVMLAVGMRCHESCFSCRFCFEALDKSTATLRDGQLSCPKCLAAFVSEHTAGSTPNPTQTPSSASTPPPALPASSPSPSPSPPPVQRPTSTSDARPPSSVAPVQKRGSFSATPGAAQLRSPPPSQAQRGAPAGGEDAFPVPGPRAAGGSVSGPSSRPSSGSAVRSPEPAVPAASPEPQQRKRNSLLGQQLPGVAAPGPIQPQPPRVPQPPSSGQPSGRPQPTRSPTAAPPSPSSNKRPAGPAPANPSAHPGQATQALRSPPPLANASASSPGPAHGKSLQPSSSAAPPTSALPPGGVAPSTADIGYTPQEDDYWFEEEEDQPTEVVEHADAFAPPVKPQQAPPAHPAPATQPWQQAAPRSTVSGSPLPQSPSPTPQAQVPQQPQPQVRPSVSPHGPPHRPQYEMKDEDDFPEAGSAGTFAWKRGDLIGKGAFGRVYMGMKSDSGELIAVKQVKLTTEEAKETFRQIQSEIRTLQGLRHPNVVNLLGIERQGDKLNIFMEYVPGKSLDTILEKFGGLAESVIRSYTRQILKALAYCHTNHVVHRDIKGKNILVDTQGNLKLCDFGSAKRFENVLSKDAPSISYNYTPLWTAPEVLTGVYNSKVDIWSLGCVLVEMATGKPPWSEQNFANPFRALYHIGNTNSIPAIPPELSSACRAFILRCLTRDPDKRPTADELLQDPWIREDAPTPVNQPSQPSPPSQLHSHPSASASSSASSTPQSSRRTTPQSFHAPVMAGPAHSHSESPSPRQPFQQMAPQMHPQYYAPAQFDYGPPPGQYRHGYPQQMPQNVQYDQQYYAPSPDSEAEPDMEYYYPERQQYAYPQHPQHQQHPQHHVPQPAQFMQYPMQSQYGQHRGYPVQQMPTNYQYYEDSAGAEEPVPEDADSQNGRY